MIRMFLSCVRWIKLFKNTLKGPQTLFVIDDCSAEGEINKKRDALSELTFSDHIGTIICGS